MDDIVRILTILQSAGGGTLLLFATVVIIKRPELITWLLRRDQKSATPTQQPAVQVPPPVVVRAPVPTNGTGYVSRNDCHASMDRLNATLAHGLQELRKEMQAGFARSHERTDKLYEKIASR